MSMEVMEVVEEEPGVEASQSLAVVMAMRGEAPRIQITADTCSSPEKARAILPATSASRLANATPVAEVRTAVLEEHQTTKKVQEFFN